MKKLTLAGTIAAIALTPTLASAQYPAPPDQVIPKALSPSAMERLCSSAQIVIPRALLGEIAAISSLNVLTLPQAPPLQSGPVSELPEGRLAAWIIATSTLSSDQAKALGLSDDYFIKLDNLRFEIVNYLVTAANPRPKAPYRLSEDSVLGEHPNDNQVRVLESFFAEALGNGRPTEVRLICVLSNTLPSPNLEGSTAVVALRGKIDDLAVPRFQSGTIELNPAFGKASEAKLAYADNDVKGDETVNVELALGVGTQLTRNDALFGYVHFVQSTTETAAPGDDDDSKDVRAWSPGILYRHSFNRGAVYATAGISAYRTHDLAQDSRLTRARLFLSDIVFSRQDSRDICNAEQLIAGPLYFDCRLGVFAEIARVHDAGRSLDLASDEDDEYAGIGLSTGLTFWVASPAALRPLSLTFDYRRMQVVSGELDDPSRFVVELGYTLPKSNVSISLSRTVGENMETFQDEDLNKLSIGFKY